MIPLLLLTSVLSVTADHKGGYHFGGLYKGSCGHDGVYIHDDYSIILCSNGIAYYQPCPPGTKNSHHTNYKNEAYYNTGAFCNVNLVDHGYNLKYGYGPHYGGGKGYGGHRGHLG